MAKKGSAKPRVRKKSKKAKESLKRQFMKIVTGVAILVCLLVTAGLLTNFLITRSSSPEKAKSKPQPSKPVTRPEPRPVHHRVPEYEAFHKETVPPPKPITRVKPITNGIPVAIIVDDIGYDYKMAEGFMALEIPLTFSVLPKGTFNHRIIDQALEKDVEIMLHLPMEPDGYPAVDPGPGALLTSMDPDTLIAQLNEDLDCIPGIKGVNNHMGSKLTASSAQMRQIFTTLKKRNLFFVDSRTSTRTVCEQSAQLFQLPFAERDVFIDHEQHTEFIRNQIKQLIKRAHRQGYAIGIAHPHEVTLKVLKEMLPELKQEVSLTHASKVVAFQEG